MNIDLMVKTAGVGVLSGVIGMVLEKSGKDEYAYVASLIGIIMIFGVIAKSLVDLINMIRVAFRI